MATSLVQHVRYYDITDDHVDENGVPVDHVLKDWEQQKYSSQLVANAFRARLDDVESLDEVASLTMSESSIESSDDDNDVYYNAADSFFVADLGMVYRQFTRWTRHLPRVEPMYAIKCNGDAKVVELFARLGMGFDCASMREIKTVLDLGVDPSKIIYANPCKTPSYLKYAERHGVEMTTFDNADELIKCKRVYPNAKLLLRIMTDDSTALCRLSVKFGASMESSFKLLDFAKKLGLNVAGVAFHVGSGSTDSNTYAHSIINARTLFDYARDNLGYEMSVLDVGGGFESESFEKTATVLRTALEQYFPDPRVRVIAEPGRYFVADAFSLATNVIGRRWVDEEAGQAMLYINDGVYGNLNCIMFDHQHPVPRVLRARTGDSAQFLHGSELNCQGKYEMSLWGPTCDGLDCISKSSRLPLPIDVGDWLYFDNMGAYTLAAASGFNGFDAAGAKVIYVCSDPRVEKLLDL